MSKKEIKNKVRLAFEDAKTADDVRKAIYEAQNNGLPVFDLTNGSDLIPPKVLVGYAKLADSFEIMSLLESPPKPPKPSAKDQKGDINLLLKEADQETKVDVALTLIDPEFRLGSSDVSDNNLKLYQVDKDSEHPEGKGLKEVMVWERSHTSLLAHVYKVGLSKLNEHISPSNVEDLVRCWSLATEHITGKDDKDQYVRACSNCFIDPGRWTQFYSTHKPNPSVPFPQLKKTLERMSEGDAFAAYIYGVFSGRYKGRQVFYIYGEHGEEGKSYLTKFLGRNLFGDGLGYKVTDSKQFDIANKFAASSVVGAKLIVYPDCSRKKFLESEYAKVLSGAGRDDSVVEKKFEAAYTAKIEARLIVCSNVLPEVKDANWYRSRLILSSIAPLPADTEYDVNIDTQYKAELDGFLAYGKECYDRLCPTNESIKVSDAHEDLFIKALNSYGLVDKDIFNTYFEIDKDSKVPIGDVIGILKDMCKYNKKDIDSWLEYAATVPSIKKTVEKSGVYFYGLAIKASNIYVVKDKPEVTRVAVEDDSFNKALGF